MSVAASAVKSKWEDHYMNTSYGHSKSGSTTNGARLIFLLWVKAAVLRLGVCTYRTILS